MYKLEWSENGGAGTDVRAMHAWRMRWEIIRLDAESGSLLASPWVSRLLGSKPVPRIIVPVQVPNCPNSGIISTVPEQEMIAYLSQRDDSGTTEKDASVVTKVNWQQRTEVSNGSTI